MKDQTLKTAETRSPRSVQSENSVAQAAVAVAFAPQEQPGEGSLAERIRDLAHQKWEAAGSPAGDGIEFWLAAEKELIPSDTP